MPLSSSSDFLRYLAPGPKHLGATTPEEQAWCRWYGAEGYTGEGAIAELGPWLGSLTKSYCEGLAKNPHVAGRHKFASVYDLFEWCETFEEWSHGSPHAGRFRAGEDFAPYFRELYSRYDAYLDVIKADLCTVDWTGGPIECVINDAAKSLRIADRIFQVFVPHMMPGKGYIAHQDFLWPTDAFIQAFMFLARDSFAYEYAIPDSCMVVFRNTGAFDPGVLQGYSIEGRMDYELIRETFAWTSGLLANVNPKMVRLGEAAILRDYGFAEPARRLCADEKLGEKGRDSLYNFELDTIRAWGYTDILPVPSENH